MYSVPKSIQIYILNILYEYDEIWSSPFYLVNKQFFTVVKSLVGSQLNFIIDSQKDEIKFQSFIEFVTGTDRLCNKPYFIYEQLEKLTICMLEGNQEQIHKYENEDEDEYEYDHWITIMTLNLFKLLKSKQWKEWNKELINSTRNHDIEVQIIDPYYYLGKYCFNYFYDSVEVTHLDICFDLSNEGYGMSPPLSNLQTLNLSTYDISHGNPYGTYTDLINQITNICKYVTKLGLDTRFYLFENSKELFNRLGGQLTRLEILRVYNNNYNDDECSGMILFLKKYRNIKEFGITEKYYPGVLTDLLQKMVDYLFSEECHIETITQVSLHSNSIPTIKRRIPYMLVSLRMISNYDKDSREKNPDISKEELKQQIVKALIEFSNIDHLVLCYCNEECEQFLIDDFVRLANDVKDYNSSLNQKVEIYFRNMKYQLLNNDVKGLSRRITKYKTIGRFNFKDSNDSWDI